MRVLVACEYSGIVRDAFLDKGHDAHSCDLLETESNRAYNRHYTGNVLDIIDKGWDMMIAHPPCTYLANSGVRWLKDNPERRVAMQVGARFFMTLLGEHGISKIAVENPIQHKHTLLPKPTQIIQPWMFGDNQTKAVCLWLKGLPKLVPSVTIKPANVEAKVWRMPPGPNRQKERSRFFPSIAEAMAEQWSNL